MASASYDGGAPPFDVAGSSAGAGGDGDDAPSLGAADVGEVVHEQVNPPAARGSLDDMPPGYRFTPLDEELVVFYLRKKILGLPLPLNKIHDVRLYDHNPPDLAAIYEWWEVGKWFFFTPRDRKYPNGSRPSRSAGRGYWKATGADKTIRRDGVVVGWRKALVFYMGRPPRGEKTNWIMHEYRAKIDGRPPPRRFNGTMRLDDWVLCCVHEKTIGHGRRLARQQADQCNNGEGGRRTQDPGREAYSPPTVPPPPPPPPPMQPLENSVDAPAAMLQASCDSDHNHCQQYLHDLTTYPPAPHYHPIVQERFPEQHYMSFPHETFQDGSADLGYQIPTAAAGPPSSAVENYWPSPPPPPPAVADNELGYLVQGNPPADPPAPQLLDGYGITWPEADIDPADFSLMCSIDLKADPTDQCPMSNPSNGYELVPAYDQPLSVVFPPTDATESGNFSSSSWPNFMAADTFDAEPFFESTGATLQITGATPATCDASAGTAAAAIGEDFAPNLVPDIPYPGGTPAGYLA